MLAATHKSDHSNPTTTPTWPVFRLQSATAAALTVGRLLPPCTVWPCEEPPEVIARQTDGLTVALCAAHLQRWQGAPRGRHPNEAR